MRVRSCDELISSRDFLKHRVRAFCYAGIFFILLIPFISSGQLNSSVLLNTGSPELKEQVLATLKESSQKFQLVENKGQLGLSENVIAYFSTSSQMVFIEKDRLRIVVLDPVEKKKSLQQSFPAAKDHLSDPPSAKKYHYNTFSILFKGSLGLKHFEKGKRFDTRRNFINSRSPQSTITGVSSYEEITLKDVYKGIDLRLYSQEKGQLEFDWIVWPGSDPDKIRMQFEGQKNLMTNAQGELLIDLKMGQFQMHMPESYYSTPDGKEIADYRFKLAGKNEITFKHSKKYNNSFPLIIDPDLMWGTFFDGASATFDEYLYSIEYNYTNQLIYCAGVANLQVSTVYAAALSSGYDGTFAAMQDALVYALSKNGQTIEYMTYLGGANNDVGTGISISGTNIFVCGYTLSSDFPVTNGSGGTTAAFDNSLGGTQDGFVAVFDKTLSQLSYCSYIGGTGVDEALTIRATGTSAFDVSLHSDASLPTSSPNYLVAYADNSFGGAEEAWIGSFTSFNSLRFGTYIGGTDVDVVNDFQILSDGDVVFIGTTKQITEVNGTVSSNATGSDVLFGRIDVPASGSVSFAVVEKFGGTGTDNGYGIYALGDSVSILVGQTKSSNFPLGSGTVIQNTYGGGTDGFIARIKNDGTGGYKASFIGGSGVDILVSVRPIIVNNLAVLLSFGTTASTNLSTLNYNSGTFYSSANSGGQDMMFLICDMNLGSKYYLSYIGGTGNDYLGATGTPVGSNHLFYNSVDSVLYVGTTTHSYDSTQSPKFVGRGINDITNNGVPVFDQTKGNGTNDTHVIFAISTKAVYNLLAVTWLNFETTLNADCEIQLNWNTTNENLVSQYAVERSLDGRNFETIRTVLPGNPDHFYNDPDAARFSGTIYYRIRSTGYDGHISYSKINAVQGCNSPKEIIRIYPTITANYVTIEGMNFISPKNSILQLYNAGGIKLMDKRVMLMNGSFPIQITAASGNYLLVIKDPLTGKTLQQQKIILVRN